jgi:hypothetical protein
MKTPRPPPYPLDARRRASNRASARSTVAEAHASGRFWPRLLALAARIEARDDHTLIELRPPTRTSSAGARLPACFPSDAGAALTEVAGVSLVWESAEGARGALRVPPLSSFATGWQSAQSYPQLGPDAVGCVVIDEMDGATRGMLVMDERGRCRCVWVPSQGEPVPAAASVDAYLERCIAHAAREGWARCSEPVGIARPTPEHAASRARVGVRCHDVQTIAVEVVCARRLASLPRHAEIAQTLGVSTERLASTLRAMDSRARPRGLGAVLRDSRRGPQSIAELRRWAYLDAGPAPWVDVALEIEPATAPTPRELARLAWLALRAAPGGEVALAEAEWLRLADQPESEPQPEDVTYVVAASPSAVCFSLPAARCPSGCVVGAEWVAVVTSAPTVG